MNPDYYLLTIHPTPKESGVELSSGLIKAFAEFLATALLF